MSKVRQLLESHITPEGTLTFAWEGKGPRFMFTGLNSRPLPEWVVQSVETGNTKWQLVTS